MLTRFVLCPTTPFPRPPHPCRCLPPCLTPSLVYSLHQSLRLCTCLSLFSSFSARSPSFSPSIPSLLASFPLRSLCRFHRSISDFHSFSFVLSVRRERDRERERGERERGGRETERERGGGRVEKMEVMNYSLRLLFLVCLSVSLSLRLSIPPPSTVPFTLQLSFPTFLSSSFVSSVLPLSLLPSPYHFFLPYTFIPSIPSFVFHHQFNSFPLLLPSFLPSSLPLSVFFSSCIPSSFPSSFAASLSPVSDAIRPDLAMGKEGASGTVVSRDPMAADDDNGDNKFCFSCVVR